MNTDFQNALHLVDGYSAASTLKDAFGLERRQLLINADLIHCGKVASNNGFERLAP